MRNLLTMMASATALLVAAGNWHQLQAADRTPPDAFLVRLDHAPQTPAEQALPLVLWTERRTDPEPLAIYVIRINLQAPQLEVVSMLADDPDGAGPAEAALEDPCTLAARYGALAAVNANAFGGLPDVNGKSDNRWRAGLPVDIVGVAAHAGELRSGPGAEPGNSLCFWLDASNRPHIEPFPATPAGVREAVNSFCGDLVKDGRSLPPVGGDRHPRTALGLDAGGRHLFCVVVDGRQQNFSVGMTSRELADLMAGLGCQRAINLDGGGSSAMLATSSGGKLEIVNHPSQFLPRPVPILLGVRIRQDASGRK